MTGLGWTVATLLAIPVCVVGLLACHELGHALPVLLAGGRAHVTVGSDSGRTVQIGRLTVTAGVDGLWRLFTYGTIQWEGVESKRTKLASIVGGPLVTLTAIFGLSLALFHGIRGVPSWALGYLLFSEVARAYKTIVPRTYADGPYEGMPSDGKRLLAVLRS